MACTKLTHWEGQANTELQSHWGVEGRGTAVLFRTMEGALLLEERCLRITARHVSTEYIFTDLISFAWGLRPSWCWFISLIFHVWLGIFSWQQLISHSCDFSSLMITWPYFRLFLLAFDSLKKGSPLRPQGSQTFSVQTKPTIPTCIHLKLGL